MRTDNYEQHWVAQPLGYDYPLTEKQYRIFCQGFAPDWEHRYETVSVDGWHYVYRSGVWLAKIRYVKQKDGMFHITEHYVKDAAKPERGFSWLEEALLHGAWEPPLFSPEEREAILQKLAKPQNAP